MDADADRAVTALSALAQQTRLALFRLLVAQGPAGLPAGAVAERLGVAPSSLSFHLQQLLHAGLVTQRRRGRQLIYAAEYDAMNGLLAYLTENCCGRGAAAAPFCQPDETLAGERCDGCG
ncbi:MAG TPA: metalloregulator ArsR/SmtB family transcription factor [Stellaceae bacterium]|nr:metalloregulator ArsR/SmtB family transcription factor [Stellaceae bacterium]